MPVKYIFWDSDNTLVNTYDHHWNKHFHTLASCGIHLDEKWQERVYTNNGSQNWEWMSSELGLKIGKDQYLDMIDNWYYDNIGSIQVRDGILESLNILSALPMCVVSNGRRRSVMAALNAKGLADKFKFILCIEDYTGRKPDPTPYLAAKTKMQQIMGVEIDPKECLVIEDDPKGVESALGANMHVIHRAIDDRDIPAFLAKLKSYL